MHTHPHFWRKSTDLGGMYNTLSKLRTTHIQRRLWMSSTLYINKREAKAPGSRWDSDFMKSVFYPDHGDLDSIDHS